jgi:hypothetical protein
LTQREASLSYTRFLPLTSDFQNSIVSI